MAIFKVNYTFIKYWIIFDKKFLFSFKKPTIFLFETTEKSYICTRLQPESIMCLQVCIYTELIPIGEVPEW